MTRLFRRATLDEGLRLCIDDPRWRIVVADFSQSVGVVVLLERAP